MRPQNLSIQVYRKEPEGRLKMRLYRSDHCLPASTQKLWPLPDVDVLPMPTNAALCWLRTPVKSPVKSAHLYPAKVLIWRRQYAAGEPRGVMSKKRGPKASPARQEHKQLTLMTRERDKLRVQLSNAQLVIEVQKKVAALLEQLDPLQKFASP